MTKTVPLEIPAKLTDAIPAPRLNGKSLAAYGEWIDSYDSALAQANCDKAVIRQINEDARRGQADQRNDMPCGSAAKED